MSEYLMRDAAPLTAAEWEAIDALVVGAAREFLVGRRFLDLVGPLGVGLELVAVGAGETRKHIPLDVIQQSFLLHWRDVEASRQAGMPLELGPVGKAALACAKMEDDMVLGGLWEAAGKAVTLGDWSNPGTALDDVVSATEKLFADDFFGPYALVLSPALYAQTQRAAPAMGRIVGKLIKDVAEGGVFRSALLDEKQGLVLSLASYNFDLVVGQDLVTAYEGNEGLDHVFRVLETIALRVKRPGAICKLEG